MRSNLIAGLIAGLGLACASVQGTLAPASPASKVSGPAGQGNGAAGSKDKTNRKLVCTYESLVGSHIPQKFCQYEDEIDAQRNETQDMLRQLTPKSTRTGNSPPP